MKFSKGDFTLLISIVLVLIFDLFIANYMLNKKEVAVSGALEKNIEQEYSEIVHTSSFKMKNPRDASNDVMPILKGTIVQSGLEYDFNFDKSVDPLGRKLDFEWVVDDVLQIYPDGTSFNEPSCKLYFSPAEEHAVSVKLTASKIDNKGKVVHTASSKIFRSFPKK